MPNYRLFGVTFASDYPFAYPLLPGEGAASFSFTCVNGAPIRRGAGREIAPLRQPVSR